MTNGNTSYGSVVASIDDGKGKAWWDEENAIFATRKSVDSIASSSGSNSSGRNKKHIALMCVTGCLVVSGVLGYKTDFSSPSTLLLLSSSSSSSSWAKKSVKDASHQKRAKKTHTF